MVSVKQALGVGLLLAMSIWLPHRVLTFFRESPSRENAPAEPAASAFQNNDEKTGKPAGMREGAMNEDVGQGSGPNSSYGLDVSVLLNIPSFAEAEWSDDGEDARKLYDSQTLSTPNTIFSLYRSFPRKCDREPYVPHLREAVREYGVRRNRSIGPVEDLVRLSKTLLVHLSFGSGENGTSLSEEFVASVLYRADKFSQVVLLPTVEIGVKLDSTRVLFSGLVKKLQDQGVSPLIYDSEGQDEDLYIMHISKNLLVHRGSFSALGALLCEGTVYYTAALSSYLDADQFKWMLKDGRPAGNVEIRQSRKVLSAMGPVVPSCCLFKPYGVGDGEKIVCANSREFKATNCWVLSVGCGGKWSFEKAIVANTSCKVHTFDCTGTWGVPKEIAHRVTLHHTCLGQENDSRENFMGLNSMVRMGSSLSGLGPSRMPALAKMDIEGHEFPVLRALIDDGLDEALPDQIAFELHEQTLRDVGPPYQKTGNLSRMSPGNITQLFQNLSTRGYEIVHRADNPFCPHCSEVTVVRRVALPAVK